MASSSLQEKERGKERPPESSSEPLESEEDLRSLMAVATGIAARARGLLLAGPNERALLLLPCNDIHTVGMKHSIDVAFIDRTGCVVTSTRGLRPMQRQRNKNAVAVIERFSTDEPWFGLGDRLVVSRMRKSAVKNDAVC